MSKIGAFHVSSGGVTRFLYGIIMIQERYTAIRYRLQTRRTGLRTLMYWIPGFLPGSGLLASSDGKIRKRMQIIKNFIIFILQIFLLPVRTLYISGLRV